MTPTTSFSLSKTIYDKSGTVRKLKFPHCSTSFYIYEWQSCKVLALFLSLLMDQLNHFSSQGGDKQERQEHFPLLPTQWDCIEDGVEKWDVDDRKDQRSRE